MRRTRLFIGPVSARKLPPPGATRRTAPHTKGVPNGSGSQRDSQAELNFWTHCFISLPREMNPSTFVFRAGGGSRRWTLCELFSLTHFLYLIHDTKQTGSLAQPAAGSTPTSWTEDMLTFLLEMLTSPARCQLPLILGKYWERNVSNWRDEAVDDRHPKCTKEHYHRSFIPAVDGIHWNRYNPSPVRLTGNASSFGEVELWFDRFQLKNIPNPNL